MSPAFATLSATADWYEAWLRDAALPLWATRGVDEGSGAFQEALTVAGAAVSAPRRARVQARQAFVYAAVAAAGYGVGWAEVSQRGFAAYLSAYRTSQGLFVALVDETGQVADARTCLYEQDFSLLAMAALHTVDPAAGFRAEADRTRVALEVFRHPGGGFREVGGHPFQANAHMHLLETALAWEAAGGGAAWTALADEVAELALTRFVDAEGGFLREFFDADWRPAAGDDGRYVEPGHQFEWAWLLERWARARGDRRAAAAARRLFDHGVRGVDPAREVAVNVLWDDLTLRDAAARLWPQTEYLKAALIFGEDGHALTAARGLARYLDTPTPGVWRDKMRPDGGFVEEPAPASSFYHIVVAVLELSAAAQGSS